MSLPNLAKKIHDFRLMMKYGMHSQNQLTNSEKYQTLFITPQNDKTDPGFKGPSPGIGFVVLRNFELLLVVFKNR